MCERWYRYAGILSASSSCTCSVRVPARKKVFVYEGWYVYAGVSRAPSSCTYSVRVPAKDRRLCARVNMENGAY